MILVSMLKGKTDTVGFTDSEVKYLMDRKLGRIALISERQEPHIVPVTYEFDGAFFYLRGWNVQYGPRFTNIEPAGSVSLLIDDLTSAALWVPKGIEITGKAERLEKGESSYLKITPTGKISWGL